MIGKAIYYILSNDATVISYVGTRIYPVIVPQGIDRPSIAYRLAGVDPNDSKQSVSTKDRKIFNISVFMKEYDDSPAIYDIAKAIRNAMDKITPGTYGGVIIGEIRYINEVDGYEEALDSFVRTQTYSAYVTET